MTTGSLSYGVVLGVLSSLAIILMRIRELVALLCEKADCVLCVFLAMPSSGFISCL